MGNSGKLMYETLPAVAALNKVDGFDPVSFLREVTLEPSKQTAYYLDLKYKKLWFRLAYPAGRMKVAVLKATEQVAIIEARIYLEKDDAEPVSSFIAQRRAGDGDSRYIEAAQYAAENQALIDAGFGIQFCDILQGEDTEVYDAGATGAVKGAAASVSAVQIAEPDEANAVPGVSPDEDLSPAEEPSPAGQPDTAEQTERDDKDAQILTLAIHGKTDDEPGDTPADPQERVSRFTPDMPLEDILSQMTLEEAESVKVDFGTCNGMTIQEVADRRAASLKFYYRGYSGDNNLIRAAAEILLNHSAEKLAS